MNRAALLMIPLVFLITSAANAKLITIELSYPAGDTNLKGYLAYDDATNDKRPGVLVVHEWWGHNEYARKRARMLAELGYVAFAVDMYGEGRTAAHPDDAGKMASAIGSNPELGKLRFDAARKALAAQDTVDSKNIAAIGYCFGGAVVLNMAQLGEPLKGVVSFHGSLAPQPSLKKNSVTAKMLILNGADDPFVTAEQITAFKAAMDQANVDYTFINYPGAKHSFTSAEADEYGKKFNMPLAYNKSADEASWAEMQMFLKKVLAQ